MAEEACSLLAILAHPDDEAFGPIGTLAKYADQGVDVYLICATRGEAGMTGGVPVSGPEELSRVRARELHCSCRVLGIRRLCFLDYRDGQLEKYDSVEVEGRILRLTREIRPQVVITFGPEGITGHLDHVAISRLTTAAFHSAGDETRYPEHLAEGLTTHTPHKLYYFSVPQSLLDQEELEGLSGVPDEAITTIVDVSGYEEARVQALYCHRTQASDYSRFLTPERRSQLGKEYYILAVPDLPKGEKVETDLFARVG